jgi:hypothetical protein
MSGQSSLALRHEIEYRCGVLSEFDWLPITALERTAESAIFQHQTVRPTT